MSEREKITAIVLAGGSGSRMGTSCKKQYLLLNERPILYYSLAAFENSPVNEVVLVTSEPEYCKEEIIEKYGLQKVCHIVPGGKERYHSVYEGLKAASGCDLVLIHDGARPFVTEDIIERSIKAARTFGACAVGMPSKDTIKITDRENDVVETPDRRRTWVVQTPQSFSYPLIRDAYERILREKTDGITDDAMIIEHFGETKVRMIEGSYQNIKITTPEDMQIGRIFLK